MREMVLNKGGRLSLYPQHDLRFHIAALLRARESMREEGASLMHLLTS